MIGLNFVFEIQASWPIKCVLFCFRFNMVYVILLIHGVGVLMPWNMFINANDVGIHFCHSKLKCIIFVVLINSFIVVQLKIQ